MKKKRSINSSWLSQDEYHVLVAEKGWAMASGGFVYGTLWRKYKWKGTIRSRVCLALGIHLWMFMKGLYINCIYDRRRTKTWGGLVLQNVMKKGKRVDHETNWTIPSTWHMIKGYHEGCIYPRRTMIWGGRMPYYVIKNNWLFKYVLAWWGSIKCSGEGMEHNKRWIVFTES